MLRSGCELTGRQEDLTDELARLEARLSALDAERATVREQITAARRQLTAVEAVTISVPKLQASAVAAPTTHAAKVALFSSLFRGREDVYPRFWTNERKGTKGWAPACSNEWKRPLCQKPKVKCGACSHQAFDPITPQVIQEHLQGHHVIGVYPLLRDERCHLLAIDFDQGSWSDDVGAFAETCRAVGLPAAVERSRSGNGAHAWFFFDEAIPAGVARRVGCYLLTETMSRRPELSMDSYDRLFPNQDTMPRGGFGNLIALPLQRAAREQGNTVFVDDALRPHADQWAFLAGLARIPAATAELVAREAQRQGRVLGVRFAAVDEDDDAPWTRSPSGRLPRTAVRVPLPDVVRIVRGQRLFVEKAGLPGGFVTELRRLAAFQNPEFYKKQAMHLGTRGTPRVVTCAEESGSFLSLPRGCEPDVVALVTECGSKASIEDQRTSGDPIVVEFQGELTEVQARAAAAVLPHDIGIVVAPPGTGKTVLGAALVARRGVSTLVLVHRKPLLDQWVAQLSEFLGIPRKEIGVVGGGKRKATGRIDVAMIQSLVRKGQVDDVVATYGHVIVDECHHVSASSFARVLSEVKARFVLGLTATPRRRDGHDPIVEMQLGPVRFAVSAKASAAARGLAHGLIIRETTFSADWNTGDPIQGLYAAMASDESRNALILDDVISALEEGRSPLLLTERRDHLELFAEKLRAATRHLIVLHGGLSARERKEALATLAAIPQDEERLVVATGRYVGEGFDDPRLDTLVLALPVAWRGTVVQYAGSAPPKARREDRPSGSTTTATRTSRFWCACWRSASGPTERSGTRSKTRPLPQPPPSIKSTSSSTTRTTTRARERSASAPAPCASSPTRTAQHQRRLPRRQPAPTESTAISRSMGVIDAAHPAPFRRQIGEHNEAADSEVCNPRNRRIF
jgi:superfamily II DNA or RNA helicase